MKSAGLNVELLEALQEGLENLYRLDPAPKVSGFLLQGPHGGREELLIVEDGDLFVGVALAPEVIGGLADDRLLDANLDRFCLAVEGVSHFLFVMHRARQEHPTSFLELELQAEVDKYVVALMLVYRCPSLRPERLRQLLYDGYRLVDGLGPDERERYHRANALARRYTRALERRYVRRRQLPAMLGELRRFYRMGYRAKHELIQRAA